MGSSTSDIPYSIFPSFESDIQRSHAMFAAALPSSNAETRCSWRNETMKAVVRTMDGQKAGALSKAAESEWEARLPLIKEVRVHSIIVWRKDYIDQDHEQDAPDEWEVPLLEVVWHA